MRKFILFCLVVSVLSYGSALNGQEVKTPVKVLTGYSEFKCEIEDKLVNGAIQQKSNNGQYITEFKLGYIDGCPIAIRTLPADLKWLKNSSLHNDKKGAQCEYIDHSRESLGTTNKSIMYGNANCYVRFKI